MKIRNIESGSFIAEVDGEKAGHVDYIYKEGNIIVLDGTDVYPDYREHGIGEKLVMEVVELARKKNMKIETVCSFASTIFSDKEEELSDVIA